MLKEQKFIQPSRKTAERLPGKWKTELTEQATRFQIQSQRRGCQDANLASDGISLSQQPRDGWKQGPPTDERTKKTGSKVELRELESQRGVTKGSKEQEA